MSCWLLLIILLVGLALGRSAKTVPCWIKAWCARKRSAMKMSVRE
ncbi:hypothetical protein GLYMA_09G223250v4 [Glycine max]|nr:hypothetical protein GYH30_025843 [Glycine max]KRH39918.2 hypothetical protein GLYMA_09G223250v4 [Glycine max]